MQFPDKKIFDNYDIDVINLNPFKDGFAINTENQRYFIKKTDIKISRIEYINYVKNYIEQRAPFIVDRYLPSKEGLPYCYMNDNVFTISLIPKGEECNFGDKADVSIAARTLAELHQGAKGIIISDDIDARSELGKLPQYFYKRLEEIKKLKKHAKKGTSKFDYLFIKNADETISTCEETIEKLNNSKYIEMCNKAKTEGCICHHDYNHGNILISEEGVGVTNFEFCCPELRVYDLANLLRRKMRKCNWDFDEALFIIEEYNRIEALTAEEYDIMGLMLNFPQKFWRVVNKYYNSRRGWYEKGYIVQLQEVIDEREPHKNFMERYNNWKG